MHFILFYYASIISILVLFLFCQLWKKMKREVDSGRIKGGKREEKKKGIWMWMKERKIGDE